MDEKYRSQLFGQRLKALRKQSKIQSQVVAESIDIARSTYAGYETQDRFPPIDTLAKLAEFFNVSTDYLLGITDDPVKKGNETGNIEEFFRDYSDRLNWDGVPLSVEDLKPITAVFELLAKERRTLEQIKSLLNK